METRKLFSCTKKKMWQMDIFILFDLAPYAIKFVNFHAKVTLFPVYSSKEISVESLVKLLPPKLS